MPRKRKVTPEVFAAVKKELLTYLPAKDIAKKFDISLRLISVIHQSDELEEYNNYWRKTQRSSRVKKIRRRYIKTNLRPVFTKEQYDEARELLFRGESQVEVLRATGLAKNIVLVISHSSSWEEAVNMYREYLRGSLRFKPEALQMHHEDLYQKAGTQFVDLLKTIVAIIKTS